MFHTIPIYKGLKCNEKSFYQLKDLQKSSIEVTQMVKLTTWVPFSYVELLQDAPSDEKER